MTSSSKPEPWLRGTHTDIPSVSRAVIHALELAGEDLLRWCGELSEEELHARPAELPSVAFQLRHIARSMDRLLTYAEGRALSEGQLAALTTEGDAGGSRDEIFDELEAALTRSMERVLLLGGGSANLDRVRTAGRSKLPTTVGGLLVHVADHTQRHVGQAVTTAKLVRSMRH
jgi:uncharacterized damage-inducible protein DinB